MIGIVLLIQLFNLQIVHGEEYRQQSNTRLSRESTLEAARGNILDQSGNKLATTTLGYCLELYKTKIDTEELNNTLFKIVQVLEKNGDSYIDLLPIKINPFSFTMSEEKAKEWKKNNNIEEEKTAEESFYILKEKYKITAEDINVARKIMTLRYEISKNGYSSTRPVELSNNISQNTLAELNEQGASFPGVNITTKALRTYTSGSLASHILGYVGQINSEEYKGREETYGINDIIGKTGIEYIMEDYLKGTNGEKQIDMAVDGSITDEYVTKEATAGSDVILTIDANLQRVTEDTLKSSIEEIQNESKVKVTGASAVVMKVRTGEVMAMASYPDFTPSDFVRWNIRRKVELLYK